MRQNSILHKALTVGVSAAMLATSVPLSGISVSAESSNNYGKALALSLYFFDANACGTGITDGPLTWRGDCHTYDGTAPVSQATGLPGSAQSLADPDGDGKIDVSGGYHDAGDHVKFNLTIGFAMNCLAAADYLNDGAFKKAGCMDHYAYVLKRGADYLMKTTLLDSSGNVQAICYQVSDLADHGYWQSPEVQTYQRNTYWMSAGNNNTKICGDMVNGLAGTAYALKDYDPEYSAKCLKYAKAIFDFGKANKGNNQEGNGGMYGNSGDSQDEFLIAHAWLWLNGVMTQPTCVPNSKQYSSEYGSEYDGYIVSWDKQYQLYSAMMYKETGNQSYKNELQAEFNDQAQGSVSNYLQKYNTKWGWGNSRYNCAWQMTTLMLADGDANSDYAKCAQFQMDYILGANSYNYCFLVGYTDSYPTHYHHRASNPGTGDANADTAAKYPCYGALIGGPDDSGYRDTTAEYRYTEPALDYNGCFALACAGLFNLFGGDGTAVKEITQQAPEINDSFVFGSGNSQETETTTTTTTTSTTESTNTVIADYATQFDYDSNPMQVGERRIIRAYDPAPGAKTPTKLSFFTQSDNIQVEYSGYGDTFTVIALAPGDAYVTVNCGSTAFSGQFKIQIAEGSTGSEENLSSFPGDADCNGLPELADAVLLARAIGGSAELSVQGAKNCDVDGTAGIGNGDLTLILQALAGLIEL